MRPSRTAMLFFGGAFVFCLIFSSFSRYSIVLATPETETKEGQGSLAASPAEGQIIAPEVLFAQMLVNAEKGQSKAMISLGILYEEGVGVTRNFSKALEWYQNAADAGEDEGYMRVGRCYEIGIGTVADMGKAVVNFEKAAALGHVPAFTRLAEVYLNGRGAPKDEKKGFDLLNKAAETGEAAAMFDLGLIALNGLYGRKAEPEKARAWFLKAAEAGHAGGILAIANMRKEGLGGKADEEGALRWYLTAQKADLQAQGLDEAIAGLKKVLPAKQIEAAEKAADAWLASRAKP